MKRQHTIYVIQASGIQPGVGEGLLGVREIKTKSKTSSIISLTGQNYIN